MKRLITVFAVILFSSSTVLAQSENESQKASPPGGMSEVDAYSLFYSAYQNENYKSALNYGRWILTSMPDSIKGYSQYDLATNMDRFISIYTGMADKSSDPAMKKAYIDTVNGIYDKVFKKFADDDSDLYQWHIDRGRLYQEHADYVDNAKEKSTVEYEKAFKLEPQKMATENDGYYVQALLQNLTAQDTDSTKKQALAIIKKVQDSAGSELSDYIDKVRNKLYDSPKERMAYLEKKVKNNPKDKKSLSQLRDMYQQQGQTKKAQSLNEKLYKLDPTYQNTISLANTAIENANYNQAVKYLTEAKEKTDDPQELKNVYLSLSNTYLNQDKLQQARKYARQAIKEDSNWGQPYLKMANIYSHAVSNCTENRDMDRNDRAVYWLIVDYLNKAKHADSSVSSTANSRIKTYQPYMPSDQDIFFKDSWKKGGSVRIDKSLNSCYGWINETTTVR